MTILLVEDDKSLNSGVTFALSKEGFNVKSVITIQEARRILHMEEIDLIVLDVNLPDGNGFDFCVEIRKSSDVPIIFLTAQSTELEITNGLDMGADDYITKPFNHLELVARVKSQLRRYDKPLNIEDGEESIKVKDLIIDTVAKNITLRDEEIKVTATEYKILHLLASNLGKVFSIKEIYEKVWEEPFYKSENTVTVHIRRIREKIEINTKEPEYIKVVWGIGYKIEKEN